MAGDYETEDNIKFTIPLLTPYKLGPFHLSHRVVHAGVSRTRCFNSLAHAHTALYYSQRATPGGLLITEATAVSEAAQGFPHSPGMYNDEQMESWKPVVKAVQAKGGVFFMQLWHVGRISHTAYQPNGQAPISSTTKRLISPQPCPLPDGVRFAEHSTPRALETHEVPQIVQQFRIAAKNAMAAGFDGVEIHCADGDLLEQFMKDSVNDRCDKYGGSMKNRCRFALEIVEGVVKEVGCEHVGIRLTPYSHFNGAEDSKPQELSVYMAKALKQLNILYIQCVEPRYAGPINIKTSESLSHMRNEFMGSFLVNGGYNREDGIEAIDSKHADAITYGRWFLSNPDLPKRFEMNAPLNQFDRETFFTHDPVVGYTDYPYLEDSIKSLSLDPP